jgi:hypothetical protein
MKHNPRLKTNFAKSTFLATALTLLLSTSSAVRAGNPVILFDNGAPNPVSADSSEGDNSEIFGNVFTENISGHATEINFAGRYNSFPTSETFLIDLYATSAGAPSTLLYSSTLANASVTQISPYTRQCHQRRPHHALLPDFRHHLFHRHPGDDHA